MPLPAPARTIARTMVLLATTFAGGSPLWADWNVTQYRDDRTNDTFNVATLPDKSDRAWLRIRCVNGRMFSAVILAKPITPPDVVRLKATYKFDSAAAVSRTAMLADKGIELWLWIGEPETTLQRIARAHRLLIELFPIGDETVSLEFDLSGANRIVPQVRCPPQF
jgi:hypothetical protein